MSPAPEEIVAAARSFVGTPYRHQAATRGAGCDCLGLVVGVWRLLYAAPLPALPPYRADWRDARHGEALLDLAERFLRPAEGPPQPGRVLLFRLGGTPLPRHCGIAVEDGRFVHAQEGQGVVEAGLSEGWRRRIAAQFDFP